MGPRGVPVAGLTQQLELQGTLGAEPLGLQLLAFKLQTTAVAIEGLFEGRHDHTRDPGFELSRRAERGLELGCRVVGQSR
jgi:hypothetical protein